MKILDYYNNINILYYMNYSGEKKWKMNSIINFITENFIQLILLMLVFVIIWLVDYIANINIKIYNMPSPIPGLSVSSNATSKIIPKSKLKSKSKSK